MFTLIAGRAIKCHNAVVTQKNLQVPVLWTDQDCRSAVDQGLSGAVCAASFYHVTDGRCNVARTICRRLAALAPSVQLRAFAAARAPTAAKDPLSCSSRSICTVWTFFCVSNRVWSLTVPCAFWICWWEPGFARRAAPP